MIYVVLGMHKSGTTLVSRILHSSGIDMGDFNSGIGYDQGNKYERAEAFELDKEILGAEDDLVLHLATDGDLALSVDQSERMQALVSRWESAHADWGMKDPRMCLTYRLWAERLPSHRLILVYRDPAHVWPRFKWTGRKGFYKNFRGAYDYAKRWVEHNRAMLDALAPPAGDVIVLSYHHLMTDDSEFARLERFIERDLTDSRKPEMYRSRSGPDLYYRLGCWWLQKRTGTRPEDVMADLRRARADQIAAGR